MWRQCRRLLAPLHLQVYYYPGFAAQRDAPKLRAELTHNLTRETGTAASLFGTVPGPTMFLHSWNRLLQNIQAELSLHMPVIPLSSLNFRSSTARYSVRSWSMRRCCAVATIAC